MMLFLTSMNVSLQVFFLSVNFKVYGIQKINDDHFLLLVILISAILGALSKFVWGVLIDKYNFKYVISVCLSLGGIFTFTFCFVSSNKLLFLIWYTVITVCERGFLTIGAPALIKIFGLYIGTNLIPAY